MREREELKERRKYRFCLIRVRFPDGLVLQGTFAIYEKFHSVTEFVSECLEHPLPFVLHDGASGKLFLKKVVKSKSELIWCSGQKLNDEATGESTLCDLGLVPTSILNFGWHPDVADEIRTQLGNNAVYLKDEIANLASATA